uniref:Serine/threonine-protein phosphatase n=1 Tax=Rhabditophanes sp. KR3021 TaxID=114890 RepID=A0AC35U0Q9_9BILA
MAFHRYEEENVEDFVSGIITSLSLSKPATKPVSGLDQHKIKNVNLERWIELVQDCKYLPEEEMKSLCELAIHKFQKVPNVVKMQSPVTICGDVHGQFYDVMKLFEVGGSIKEGRYVCLGDYVDRGYYSLEVLTYLLLHFVRYPENLVLIRGNHESARISQQYGFYDECLQKYGNSGVWGYCINVFNVMPIGALIDDNIFCVHGGLSPEIKCIDQLYGFDRAEEIPMEGPLCDILWSDPEEDMSIEFDVNPRGAGWIFSKKPVDQFCHDNDIQLICRSHQLVHEGFKQIFDGKLCTVWSAPNYCYRCGNQASIMEVKNNMELEVKYFDAVEDQHRVIPSKSITPYFFQFKHASFDATHVEIERSVTETLRLLNAFQFVEKHDEVYPANWDEGSDTINPKKANDYVENSNK